MGNQCECPAQHPDGEVGNITLTKIDEQEKTKKFFAVFLLLNRISMKLRMVSNLCKPLPRSTKSKWSTKVRKMPLSFGNVPTPLIAISGKSVNKRLRRSRHF